MSWLSNIFGGSHKSNLQATSTPRDPEAPIKNLIKNAPMPSGQLGENARLKRELLGSFKKGGKVKKTGIYKLHKGEEVLNKKEAMAGKMKNEALAAKMNSYTCDRGHRHKDMSVNKTGDYCPDYLPW